MNTLLRSLLVWLLLLALPYQGFASAGMAACAPVHGKATSAAAQPAHGAAHAAQQPPCHGAATVVHEGGKQHKAEHGGSTKCASCASCGVAVALLPALLPALAIHAQPSPAAPAADGHLPSVHLALPERPPRPRLA